MQAETGEKLHDQIRLTELIYSAVENRNQIRMSKSRTSTRFLFEPRHCIRVVQQLSS